MSSQLTDSITAVQDVSIPFNSFFFYNFVSEILGRAEKTRY